MTTAPARPAAPRELRDQLMTLLLAGHETTATALAWTFDLLLHSPRAHERLAAEIDDGGREYIDAVIEESMRVRPELAFTGRELREPMTLDASAPPSASGVRVRVGHEIRARSAA